MADIERTTKVKVEPEVKFGEFANAFRIVEEVGEDCFLDFMIYSAQAREAVVVARVRVRRDFLPAIRDRLGEAVVDFDALEDPDPLVNVVFRKDSDTVH